MKWLLTILISLMSLLPVKGQNWQLPPDKDHVIIPFDFVNNLIIVPVLLNDEPLSFIIDNGVKETLLFGEVLDSVKLKNTSSFSFQGFGIGEPIKGLMSLYNKLQVGGLVDTSHHLYVITDSAFNISKNIGIHIHGILGSTFFRNNVVSIDYVKKKITFAKRTEDLNVKLSKYQKLPISIENERAYARVNINAMKQRYADCKMLLDLGNSDPMMIFHREFPEYKISPPSIREYLGFGFNGAVHGYKNRIKNLQIADFDIKLPIVSYPDSNSYDPKKLVVNRMGSIGNQILSRFYLVFDYVDNVVYMRPNKYFDKPYTLDMSGIEVVHEGFEFVKHRLTNFSDNKDGRTTINFSTEVNYQIELHATYIIDQVRPNSPAERAGVMIGDRLLRINGRGVGKMKLQDIKNKLQAGQDKLVKIKLARNDEEMSVEFRLVDPLALPII